MSRFRFQFGLVLAQVLATSLPLTLAGAAAAGPVQLKAEQVKALGVRVETLAAATGPGVAATAYPARVVVPSAQQRVVAAPLPGLVLSVSAAVGDVVRAGQTLAVLRSSQVQELQRDALQAGSQADLARRSIQRDEALFKEGLISEARLDASRATHQQVSVLRNERYRALAQSGARSDESGSGDLALRSPIAGVLLEAPVAVGQRVEPATALFRVANLGSLWLELQVPASAAETLRVGDVVRVPGVADEGRVVSLGQAVDAATQAVMVRAEIRPAAGTASRLRPGQLVEVRVEQRMAGVVQVAESALVRSQGEPAVFIEHAPGAYRLAPVKVRASAGGMSSVQGLLPGSRVVVAGTAALLALVKS